MGQLLVKENCLPSPFPTLGLFHTPSGVCIQCLMHIPPVPKHVGVHGIRGCLFNDIKTITLLQPIGVLGKQMIPTLSCREQTLNCLAVAIRCLFFPFSSPLTLVSSCVVYKMNGALNEAIDRNSERLYLSVTKG